MIDRYTLPEMGRVWSEAHKYELWCRVETLVLEAHALAGTVPADAVGPVRAAVPTTPAAVAALREHGLAHRHTLRSGRTHGIHAEPDLWGHRVADFAFAAARSRDRVRRAREAVAVGKLSGPVGSYSKIGRAIEAEVMPALRLRAADAATQVVIRDGIAEWVSALAVLATVCEAIALEVRHGQRTEVRELAEPFRS